MHAVAKHIFRLFSLFDYFCNTLMHEPCSTMLKLRNLLQRAHICSTESRLHSSSGISRRASPAFLQYCWLKSLVRYRIFHIPQAQAYCNGDWSRWDPKLTTPPGLYLASASVRRLTGIICSVTHLRALNTTLVALLPFVFSAVLRKLRSRINEIDFWLESLTLATFPLVYFFAFLYYTDVASLFVILLCYLASKDGRHSLAGFVRYAPKRVSSFVERSP